MFKRNFFVALAFICALFSLSGCLPHTELDKQAIIEAIGVDYSDGMFEVSVQYFNMEDSGGSTLVDSSKANVVIVKGRGTEIRSALEGASAKCGRPFMFGTTAAIVFGEEAARLDLVKSLSFAETYYQSNPKTLIAVARGSAAEIMDVKFKDGAVSVDHLRRLMVHAEELGLCETKPLYRVMNELRQPTGCTVLPLLGAAETQSATTDSGTVVELSGGAVFSDKRLVGEISLSDLSGLQFLNNSIKNTTFLTNADGRSITVSLYSSKTELEPHYNDGKLSFAVKINAVGKYIDSQLQDEGIPYSEAVEEQCEQLITERLSGAVVSAVNSFGTDPVGLSHTIMSKNPTLWYEIKDSFGELLKTAELEVECRVEIDRFGVTH